MKKNHLAVSGALLSTLLMGCSIGSNTDISSSTILSSASIVEEKSSSETSSSQNISTNNEASSSQNESTNNEASSTQEISSSSEPTVDNGLKVTFVTDDHAKVFVYTGQDYTQTPVEATETYSLNSETLLGDSTGEGQVNFYVACDEGYSYSINIEGTYKNLKGPTDTKTADTYRVTKIASELVITITTLEKEDEGFAVNFVVDDNIKVYVYLGQGYTESPIECYTTNSINSSTLKGDSTGEGQVNFYVECAEGYTYSINIEGTYKNLKGPSDTKTENTYRITKIETELTVTITSAKEEQSSDQPVE